MCGPSGMKILQAAASSGVALLGQNLQTKCCFIGKYLATKQQIHSTGANGRHSFQLF